MIIKSVKLTNFRQYKDAYLVLDDKVTEQKNVIIVRGGNGAGKTAFTQAFRWCLYDMTDFRDGDLLNADVMAQMHETAKPSVVSVELTIENKDKIYKITRSLRYVMKEKGIKEAGKSTISVIENGKRELSTHEVELLVKSLIPKQLASYFFFDGERMQRMVEELLSGKSSDIQQAVRGLVGLSSLESLLRHLKDSRNTTVLKKIEKNIDLSGNSEMEQLSKDIEELTREKERLDKAISDNQAQFTATTQKRTDIAKELATYADVESLQAEWNQHEDNKKKYDSEKLKKQRLFISNFSSDFSSFVRRALCYRCNGLLKADGLDEKGVPDIQNTTLDYIIKRGRCICGKVLSENPDCLEELNHLYEFVPPMSAGTMIREVSNEISSVLNHKDTFYENMTEYIYAIDDAMEKYDIEEQQQQTIDKNILKYGNDIQRLKEEELSLKEKEEFLHKTIYIDTKKLGEVEQKLGEKIQARERRISANKSSQIWVQRRDYAEALYSCIADTYYSKEKDLQKLFQKNINEFFQRIYQQGIHISVDEKYRINIDSKTELSTAQYYSVVFAFLATTLKMARDRQPDDLSGVDYPETYPLVMDAPLSAFEKAGIRKFCEVVPNLAEQVVIFIKDTDGDEVEKHLHDEIAKIFEIKINDSFHESVVSEVN